MRRSYQGYKKVRRARATFGRNEALYYAERFVEGDQCERLTPAQFSHVADFVCTMAVSKTWSNAKQFDPTSIVDFNLVAQRAERHLAAVLARLCNHSLARRGTWLAMLRHGVDRPRSLGVAHVASCERAMRDGVVRLRVIRVCRDVEMLLRMMRERKKGEYRYIFHHAVGEEWIGVARDGRWVPIFEQATTSQLAELSHYDLEYALRDVGDCARPYLLDLVARWPRPE